MADNDQILTNRLYCDTHCFQIILQYTGIPVLLHIPSESIFCFAGKKQTVWKVWNEEAKQFFHNSEIEVQALTECKRPMLFPKF